MVLYPFNGEGRKPPAAIFRPSTIGDPQGPLFCSSQLAYRRVKLIPYYFPFHRQTQLNPSAQPALKELDQSPILGNFRKKKAHSRKSPRKSPRNPLYLYQVGRPSLPLRHGEVQLMEIGAQKWQGIGVIGSNITGFWETTSE